jgi:peptidoglycan/LPS O-acetylase OafA/YrhL
VALVLLFHAGFGWMTGGYLGVSVFFTLSGFLITRLLVTEFGERGRVSYGHFYSRRARRLLPASLLCVALIVIARELGEFSHLETLKADAGGALGQVFNWVRLGGHSSYADLLGLNSIGGGSPFEHYWSLAIEEQFYLFWPLVLTGLLVVARRCRWSVLPLIGVLTMAFAAAAPLIAATFGPQAAYWATPARLAEILIGAVVAVWIADGHRVPVAAGRMAGPLLLAIVAIACVVPSGSGPAYEGYLPVFAVISAALIFSLQAPSITRRVLSLPPIVAVGRVSYGIYLFHWPVFVVLRSHGWDLTTWRGFVVAIAVTGALATLSYVFVERPIRYSTWRVERLRALAMTGAATAVALVVVSPGPLPVLQVDSALLAQASIQPVTSLAPLRPFAASPGPAEAAAAAPIAHAQTDSTAGAATSTPPTTTTFPVTIDLPDPPSRPVRVLVVGDSTALSLGQGLAAWQTTHAEYVQSSVIWAPGVGCILDGTLTAPEAAPFLGYSQDLVGKQMPAQIAALRPDVVVLMSTLNDIATRQWPGDPGGSNPGDALFRERMTSAYTDLSASILGSGVAEVVWIIPPVPTTYGLQPELKDPLRYQSRAEVIREVAGANPSHVAALDLARWFDESGATEQPNFRPDGLHMSVESATWLAQQYLAPRLVRLALGEEAG